MKGKPQDKSSSAKSSASKAASRSSAGKPAGKISRELRELAGLYGVQLSFTDVLQRRQHAEPETVLRLLQLLGAPVLGWDSVPEALRGARLEFAHRLIEPAAALFDDEPQTLTFRLAAVDAGTRIEMYLQTEDGHDHHWAINLLADCGQQVVAEEEIEGIRFLTLRWPIPHPLPAGYHRLTCWAGHAEAECLLIVAPRRAFRNEGRHWGVFLPLYALQTEQSLGAGDLRDLSQLAAWAREQGADVVATLPLMTSYFRPGEPVSPYGPASRLFWNEFYLDVRGTPEFEQSAAAQRLMSSDETARRIEQLRSSRLIDYQGVMQFKREVLQVLAREFFDHGTPARREELASYLAEQPDAEDYARFRAVHEAQDRAWMEWPTALQQGQIGDEDFDRATYEYYLYAQWQAHQQIHQLSAWSAEQGMQFYLDFPLGVQTHSYDVWRNREIFALGASAGAPPDDFFTKGQNWGFPPLHPHALRASGYQHWIAALRRQFNAARMLRIDHVMSLHRLYWTPDGLEGHQGAYVQYPSDELYAVIALESHRRQASVIGENLGTVPREVTTSLRRHGIDGMYVLEFGVRDDARQPIEPAPQQVAASLNTHDIAMFAAYATGADIDDRLDLQLMTPKEAKDQKAQRAREVGAMRRYFVEQGALTPEQADDLGALMAACQRELAKGKADFILVNLEDLWLETEPQNVPGTWLERPNWRRRAALDFETFSQRQDILTTLRQIDERRRAGKRQRRGSARDSERPSELETAREATPASDTLPEPDLVPEGLSPEAGTSRSERRRGKSASTSTSAGTSSAVAASQGNSDELTNAMAASESAGDRLATDDSSPAEGSAVDSPQAEAPERSLRRDGD